MSYRPNSMSVLPNIVKNLLIINGLMFLATIVLAQQGIDLNEYLALHHWRSNEFRIWQPITHLFMHGGNVKDLEGGFMHLFSNMFALWMFGSILENTLGPKKFLTFYLLCGLGAAAIYLGVLEYEFSCLKEAIVAFDNNPTYKEYTRFLSQNYPTPLFENDQLYALKSAWEASPMNDMYARQSMNLLDQYYDFKVSVPCVGASGAVFGLLFAFGYLFPNSIIYVFFSIPMKAKYFVALYAAFELYAGIRNTIGDNIAHSAHLGGMLIAFIVLKMWSKSLNRNY